MNNFVQYTKIQWQLLYYKTVYNVLTIMYCVCMKTGYLKMNCVNDYIVIVSDVSNHTIHSYYH